MEELVQLLASSGPEFWEPIVIGIGAGLAIMVFIHARHAFLHWRARRRLEREGELFPDEVLALRMDLAEDPDRPEPDLRRDLGNFALSTATFVLTAVVFALELPFLWELAIIFTPAALALAYSAWRKANDPPPPPEESYAGPPEVEVPRDALAGFLAAMVVIGALLLIIWLA